MKPMDIKDAQALMPRNEVAHLISEVNRAIESAARLDKTETRVDFLGRAKGQSFVLSPSGQKVRQQFEGAGYDFRDVYEERQFVDIGLKIIWPESQS